jgi:hypothetical protein
MLPHRRQDPPAATPERGLDNRPTGRPPRRRLAWGAMRRLLLAATLATAVLPVPAAGAATTFGSDLSQPLSSNGRCTRTPCSVVTATRAGGAAETGSPIDGVLVRVRFRYAGDGAAGAFRVLRTVGATTLRNVGPELPFAVPANAAGDVFSFDVRHPIERGDRIGLAADASFTGDRYLAFGGDRSCQVRQTGTAGADGLHAAGTDAEYVNAACELIVQGTVEPDADGDGRGDETQDSDDDNDRVRDAVERRRGTSTIDLDTDDDGLSDLREPRLRLDPRRSDTDRDRLPDGLELGLRRGISDPPGDVRGTDRRRFRADRDPRTRTSPRRSDTDGDGRKDGAEDRDRDGRVDRGESDPRRRGDR